MLVLNQNMRKQTRENLKEGDGEINFIHCIEDGIVPNCRLFSLMTVPPNTSVGHHVHLNETEIYYILSGTGTINDNGNIVRVKPGDVISTLPNEGHSLVNDSEIPLIMMAIIILSDEK